jgi:cytoskeletal protein RodZ
LAQTPSPQTDSPIAESVIGDVGPLLRQTRQQKGKDIATIADALRIRREHLLAIEEGRYSALPGPTYAVGFVRAYAEHLGLDGGEIIRRFKAEGQSLPGGPTLSFPAPVREGGMPSGVLLVIALLLAGLVYGGWQLSTSADGSVAAMIQDLPDRFVALIGGETGGESVDKDEATKGEAAKGETAPAVVPAAPTPAPASDAPAVPGTATSPTSAVSPTKGAGDSPLAAMPSAPASALAKPEKPTKPEKQAAAEGTTTGEAKPAAPVEAAAPAAAPATQPAAVADTGTDSIPPNEESESSESDPTPATTAPSAEVTPGPFNSTLLTPEKPPVQAEKPTAANTAATVQNGPADSGVVIVARSDAWIEVTSDGTAVVKRMLRRGEQYTVPQGKGMQLRTGNAGGTQILLNGKLISSLGESGQVASGVSLAPEDLRKRLAD